MGKRNITRVDEHISKYLQHPVYGSRNLHTRHLHQIDSYDARVEEQLKESGFYHVFQIRRIMSHGPTIDALVERWRPETHTFHLPHGECTITLEDVALIFGLRTHGLPVTGSTDHNTSGLENECMIQFGIAPALNDHRRSRVKLARFRTLKRRQHLTDACALEVFDKTCAGEHEVDQHGLVPDAIDEVGTSDEMVDEAGADAQDKGYDLRIDLARKSASKWSPSTMKKRVKKGCSKMAQSMKKTFSK
ncbi:uncharacterized protein DS421_5g151270 [Arachis hypogaea]|nr:uncharacterized protein DS421_5g151270 [Arachis hypogaea]